MWRYRLPNLANILKSTSQGQQPTSFWCVIDVILLTLKINLSASFRILICSENQLNPFAAYTITKKGCVHQMKIYKDNAVKLQWLEFRNRSWVPRESWYSCIHYYIWDNLGWFSIFILMMVCYMYSLESPRWGDSIENTQHTFMLEIIEKISIICRLTRRSDKHSVARTTPVSNIFHGSEGVRGAIDVPLYFTICIR